MADEQYRWLDRKAAERLLSGEPPETADPAARDQAERLTEALGALSVPTPPAGRELPGEAAALAAFRTVREARAASDAAVRRSAGAEAPDAGPHQTDAARGARSGATGGLRWRCSLRFSLAVALGTGMVGGAAALAVTGVLSLPSGGTGPDPDTSVTATRPVLSPPPNDGVPGGTTPGPGEDSRGAAQDGPGDGGGEEPGKPGADAGGAATRSGGGWKQIDAACRALREGEELHGERRRLVEGAAGGSSRVDTYCAAVLSTAGPGSSAEEGTGQDGGSGNGKSGGGSANGNGKSGGGSANGNGKSGGGPASGNGKSGGGSASGNGKSGGKGNSGGSDSGKGRGNSGDRSGKGAARQDADSASPPSGRATPARPIPQAPADRVR